MSSINACQYCVSVHTTAAVALGMEAEAVAAVCERPQAPKDARLAPVLTYVAKLTTSPASVGEADVARILDAGWSEDAVSFAAFVAGLYGFMNRVVEGHGIRGSEQQLAANGRKLAEVGYAGLARMLAG